MTLESIDRAAALELQAAASAKAGIPPTNDSGDRSGGPHQLRRVLTQLSRGREVRDEVEAGRVALQTFKQATCWGGEIQHRQIFLK
jgi:hypothetical protein